MKVSQDVKDWAYVVGAIILGVTVVAWVIFAIVCQFRATQECSGTNGVVVKQASIFEPVACVQVPR